MLLNSPKNVSEGSEMLSSMIWMDTVCRESPVKIRVLVVVMKSKPAESFGTSFMISMIGLCTVITIFVVYLSQLLLLL